MPQATQTAKRRWPLLLAGLLLLGAWAAALVLLRPQSQDGEHARLVWRRQVEHFQALEPAHDGGCYLLSGEGVNDVQSLDPQGRLRWRWREEDTPPSYSGLSVTASGLLLSGWTADAAMLDLEGNLVWQTEILPWEDYAQAPSTVPASYLISSRREIWGLDSKGTVLWMDTIEVGNPFDRLGLKPTDAIQFSYGFEAGQLFGKLISSKGEQTVLYESGKPNALRSQNFFIPDSAVVNSDWLYLVDTNSVMCFDLAGKLHWSQPISGSGVHYYRPGKLTLHGESLVLITGQKQVQALGADGDATWTVNLADEILGLTSWGNRLLILTQSPAGSNNSFLPASPRLDLDLACYSSAGAQLWQQQLGISIDVDYYSPNSIYIFNALFTTQDKLYLAYYFAGNSNESAMVYCVELKP